MNITKKIILIGSGVLTSFLFTGVATANSSNSQGLSEGKDFADNFLGNITQDAQSGSSNVNTLLPGLDTTGGNQQPSYDNPGDLNEKGYEKASQEGSNESFVLSTVQDQANDNTYRINGSNPMIKNLKTIDQNVTGLIENNYTGCASLPVNASNNIFAQRSCSSNYFNRDVTFSCVKEFTSICQNPLAGQPKQFNRDDFVVTPINALAQRSKLPVTQVSTNKFRFGIYGNNYRSPGGGCHWYEDKISFSAEGKDVSKFFISNIRYDDWIEIIVNGEVVISDVSGGCERSRTSSYPDTDIADKLNNAENEIIIRHQVAGGGEIAFMFDIESEEACDAIESYQTTCTGSYNPFGADVISSQCIGGTHVVDESGETVCVKEQTQYKYTDKGWMKSGDCEALDNSSCKVKSEICVETNNQGECIEKDIEYDCPTSNTTEHQLMCGETLICPDGDCSEDTGREQIDGTDDFKMAMASLGVAEELADGIGADMLSVFKATGKKCKTKPFGIADCCQDTGWGLDFSLAQCSAEEKEIGIAKDKETTTYLGSYKQDEDALGLVVSTVESYCVYPSKLSRIIAEQGKQQLGKSFGSAKNPNCSGFTVEELEALDFDAMDLSDFYSDVMQNQADTEGLDNSGAVEKLKNSLPSTFGGI